ncbi:MAG: hypothetical protein OH354_04910, partial [Candidatus Parvarchaeota archaeon]|nr:hypothetical protein [Candidatus Jingweiarchaeum tengchongense]
MKKREVKDKQTVVKKEKEVHKKSDLLKKLIPILLVAIVLIAMIYYQITKTGSTHTQEPKKEVEISFKEVKGNQTIIENTGTEEIEKIKVFVDDRLVDEIEVNLKPNESITITFVPPLEAEKNHTIKLIAILPSGGSFVFEFTVPSSEATPSDGYIYLAPCEFPTFGEWIVNKSTYCGDTIINLNGNLTIRTGGEITYPLLPFSTALFLHNVTLRINSSYDGEYGIQVGDMGALYVLNSKITNGDFEDANFFFEVRPGATLQINNSE